MTSSGCYNTERSHQAPEYARSGGALRAFDATLHRHLLRGAAYFRASGFVHSTQPDSDQRLSTHVRFP
jgi:hypothetical protein